MEQEAEVAAACSQPVLVLGNGGILRDQTLPNRQRGFPRRPRTPPDRRWRGARRRGCGGMMPSLPGTG